MKPCDVIINCPCSGSPLMGVDAMAADPSEFVATGYEAVVPDLGNSTWTRLECMMFAESTVSEADAQATANRNALLCAFGALSPYIQPGGGSGGGGGGNVFFSNEASCTVNCPDGLPFTFSVAAGAFVSNSSQADADAKASTFACSQAQQRALCMGNISQNIIIVGLATSITVSATGGLLGPDAQWTVSSGSLPPGLTLTSSGTNATISGTATGSYGTYTFGLTVTDKAGDTLTKLFTIYVCTIEATVLENSDGNIDNNGPNGCQQPAPHAGYVVVPAPAPFIYGFNKNGANTAKWYNRNLLISSPVAMTWNWQATGSGLVPSSSDPYLKGIQNYTAIYANQNQFNCTNGRQGVDYEPLVAGDGTLSAMGTFGSDVGNQAEFRFTMNPNGGTSNITVYFQATLGQSDTATASDVQIFGRLTGSLTSGGLGGCPNTNADSGFIAQSPSAPYTDSRVCTQANNGFVRIKRIRFESIGPKTWNWRLSGTGGVPTAGDPSHTFTQLFLYVPNQAMFNCPNNTSIGGQNPNVANDGTFSLTGTLTTDTNSSVLVDVYWTPQAAGTCEFAWY